MCAVQGFASALRRFIAEKFHQTQVFRELAALTDRQLEDIGLQRHELVLAVAGAAEAPERVGMMASRLGIDGACFEARRPLLNQMVKRCAACRTKVRCAWWLAEGGAKDAYREFCPNAGAFVELSHAQLSDIIDQESYWIVADGKRIEFRGKGGPQEKIPYRMLPKRSFSGRPEGFQILFLWPCAAFLMLPGADVLLVFLMNPSGPERTSEPLLYYTLDGRLDATTKSAVDWFNDVLGPEDVQLVENVQRGLHSLAYKNGRLMSDPKGTSIWGEHILHHFNRLVIEAITGR